MLLFLCLWYYPLNLSIYFSWYYENQSCFLGPAGRHRRPGGLARQAPSHRMRGWPRRTTCCLAVTCQLPAIWPLFVLFILLFYIYTRFNFVIWVLKFFIYDTKIQNNFNLVFFFFIFLKSIGRKMDRASTGWPISRSCTSELAHNPAPMAFLSL